MEPTGGAVKLTIVKRFLQVITLTSTMLRRDFRPEGRNLAQLGPAGRIVGEIRSIVETGPTG